MIAPNEKSAEKFRLKLRVFRPNPPMENSFYWELQRDASKNSQLCELARVFVLVDHVASFIVNANHAFTAFESCRRTE
jgi:hypothetical protein